MDITVEPGKYVVAVSGGVDSMVLLDLFSKLPDIELVIAHFDHGIRPDSSEDRKFVEKAAKRYGIKFDSAEGRLGRKASEETARNARYDFLRRVKEKHSADAIITAHHEDDLTETAIINILRGTGPKGLSALASKTGLLRPMLGFSKLQILKYANDNNLDWREDPSNKDIKYLRNYVRHEIIPKLKPGQREKLLKIIKESSVSHKEAGELIRSLKIFLPIERKRFNSLSHAVSKEVLGDVLRREGIYFDSKILERLSVELKTKPPTTKLDISGGWYFLVGKQQISLHRFKGV